MACLLCGGPTPLLSTKMNHGKLCKKCASKLPSLLLTHSDFLQEGTLQNAMDVTRKNMESFCATSSYGKLHIDEMHGLFALAKDLDKDGKPKSGNNVFSIYNLTDVGLSCTSPRADHSVVVVDVEFRFSVNNPYLSDSIIVKKGVHCKTKRVDSQHVEWETPSDMVMFKTLFNNMLSGAFEKVNAVLCGKTVHEFEIEKARAIFMLTEDYTAEDLKKARRMMLKVYHPDEAGEEVTREAQIINKSYNLLKAELELKN